MIAHKFTSGRHGSIVYVWRADKFLLNGLLMHGPDGKVMVALTGTRYGLVLDPLSNSFPSDLSPSGLWELGPVLENDEIYQGYSERFALKFPVQCQVV